MDKQEKNQSGVLMKGTLKGVFGSSIDKSVITSIIFEKQTENLPDYAWDVSAAKDQSVMAWEKDGILYICGKETIKANPNCASLFSCYENLESIDFGNMFDTSDVTIMRNMFGKCSNLIILDVSGFDTRNVTDMSGQCLVHVLNCRSWMSVDFVQETY